MSICDESQITYEANGQQVLFTFPFEYLKDTDIWVGLWNEFSRRYEVVHYWPDPNFQPTTIAKYYWTLDNATTIRFLQVDTPAGAPAAPVPAPYDWAPVSYTHLRAHETRNNLVCRLLLEKNLFLMIRRPPRSTQRTRRQRQMCIRDR